MKAEQVIPRLMELGFQFRSFETYPGFIGVERNEFVALLRTTETGDVVLFGGSGYLLDGKIAVLVEHHRGPAFQWKQREVPASPEMLDRYRRFLEDVKTALADQSSPGP